MIDNLKLTRLTNSDNYINTFIISSEDKILNAMNTKKYGDGDSGTNVYVLNGQNILLVNYGDNSSILLITNPEPVDPIAKKFIVCARDIKSHFQSLQQSVINLLYQFYDVDLYGVFSKYNGTFYVKHNSKTKKELILKVVEDKIVITNCTTNKTKSFSINQIDTEMEDIRKMI